MHMNAAIDHEGLSGEVRTFIADEEQDEWRAVFFGGADPSKRAF